MKNYCKDALQGKNIKTFAATCSKVGHEPRDVIFATSFDLVLFDEAVNVTERVEIIPNDQGNCTTPGYVAFTEHLLLKQVLKWL